MSVKRLSYKGRPADAPFAHWSEARERPPPPPPPQGGDKRTHYKFQITVIGLGIEVGEGRGGEGGCFHILLPSSVSSSHSTSLILRHSLLRSAPPHIALPLHLTCSAIIKRFILRQDDTLREKKEALECPSIYGPSVPFGSTSVMTFH